MNGYFPQASTPLYTMGERAWFSRGASSPEKHEPDKSLCPWPTNLRGLSEYRDRLVCWTIDDPTHERMMNLTHIMNYVVTTMAL
jgi:hypothetical protein